ncbi:MAG: UDP-glucose 4-epimerase GalE [archaeon]
MENNDRSDSILVTGGAGYIGSVVSELLIKENYKVIVVDDLRDGNKKAVQDGARLYVADFGNPEVLAEIFSTYKVSCVLHLAASANVPDSVINPLAYYRNNVTGTISLLNMMKNSGVGKIIFSSTAAVYGEPQYLPIDEVHPLLPVNPYGSSKLMVEQIIKDCSAAYGMKYVIFRYFCAAGATRLHGESRHTETHLIPVILDQVLGKRSHVNVYGKDFCTKDGTGVRDYIHVMDIARAHLLAIRQIDRLDNPTLNLGTSSGYSVLEVIEAVSNRLGVKVNYEIRDRRPGDPAGLVASYNTAKETVGWTPQNGLEEIIESAYKWRANPIY